MGLRSFLGLAVDKKLIRSLPNMDQRTREKHLKMSCLRKGSAATGFFLNSVCMLFWPSFLFGAAFSLRQLLVTRQTQKMILQAMRTTDPSVERVSGQRRYFLCGAGMKAVIFVVFLGHIHAEDAVVAFLTPAADQCAADLSHAHLQELVQHGVHEIFELPHAFNANPVVHALQEIGGAPQQMLMEHLGVQPVEAVRGVLDMGGLARWPDLMDSTELAHQIAIGPAMEVNVPAEMGQRIMEDFAESRDGRRRRNESYPSARNFRAARG